MKIPRVFLLSTVENKGYPFSYLFIKHLSKFRLIGCDTFGPCSPLSVKEKIASFALKIFVVYPALVIGTALDLALIAFWPIRFPFVICCDGCECEKIKQALLDLVASLALPILGFIVCVAGKSPAVLCPRLLNGRFENIVAQNVFHNVANNQEALKLINQCFDDGLKLSFHQDGKVFAFLVNAPHINYELVRFLFKKCTNPTTQHRFFYDSLREAVRNGDLQLTQLLLEEVMDPGFITCTSPSEDLPHLTHLPLDPLLYKEEGCYHRSVLMQIIREIDPSNQELFKLILKTPNIDVNKHREPCGYPHLAEGATPLTMAIILSKFECAQDLVAAGANFNETPFNQFLDFLYQLELNWDQKPEYSRDRRSQTYEEVEKFLNRLMEKTCMDHCETNIYYACISGEYLLPKWLEHALREKSEDGTAAAVEEIKKFREQLEKQKSILTNLQNARIARLTVMIKNAFKSITLDKQPIFSDVVAQKIAAYADARSIHALRLVCKTPI